MRFTTLVKIAATYFGPQLRCVYIELHQSGTMVNVVYPTCNPEYSDSWPCNATIGHVLSISVVAVGEFQLLCSMRGTDCLFWIS